MKRYFILICTLLLSSIIAWSQDTYTDPRDGIIYPTFKSKDSNTWLASNLRYNLPGTQICPDGDEDKTPTFEIIGDTCLNFYTYEEAQIACPPGWHLATEYEWEALLDQFGGWKKAGKFLKDPNYWEWDKTVPTKEEASGFNAIPQGYIDHNDQFCGCTEANWWCQSDIKPSVIGNSATFYGIQHDISKVQSYGFDVRMKLSVRCVKD